MKKIILIIIASVAFVATSSVHAAEVFTKDLYYGIERDSQATQLQEFLNEQGLYGGPITGNFYSLTLKAVKAFQQREGIVPAAGYFGPKTRQKANELIGQDITASTNQSVSETGQIPQPTQPAKTTTDVVSSLQSQINLLLQQVGLLQQQLNTQQQTNTTIQNLQGQVAQQTQQVQQQTQVIQQQQQTLQQIQQNTAPPTPTPAPTPAPIVSDVEFSYAVKYNTANTPEPYKEYIIAPKGENFKVEVITYTATSTEDRNLLYPGGGPYFSLYLKRCDALCAARQRGAEIPSKSGNPAIWECFGADILWNPYPYPCPGKEIRTSEENQNASIWGYTIPAVDWTGSFRYTLELQDGQEYVPTSSDYLKGSISLYYIKLVGVKTGKVVEKTF